MRRAERPIPLRVYGLLLAAFAAGILLLGGCERVQTITLPGTTDTVRVVDSVPVLHVDTLTVTHVDTVPHYDTVTQTITVAGPPVHDSIIVMRVDTVLRVDTVTQVITLPGAVVHDTTWLYTQTNPTNPFAGGDPTSGLLVLQVWPTYYLVFWHAHMMGVLEQGGYATGVMAPDGNAPGFVWYAYAVPTDGSIVMPLFCSKLTWQEAAACLQPLVLTLSPTQLLAARVPWPAAWADRPRLSRFR